jgi:adenosylcobinamide kinase / adenosylcobinamide-phosphate guanylyltransferase
MADSDNMADKKVILVGGGARSGKSRFALSLARRLGDRRLFLATAQAQDDEMRVRIAAHRECRGPGFSTLEEPQAIADALRDRNDVDVVVIDCLTLWLSNLLLDGNTPSQIEAHVGELAQVLGRRTFHTVVVTNEVGMGIVPETPLGRIFRDVAGSAHQALSQAADEVYFAVLGTMLRLKPTPAYVPWDEIA